MVIVDISTDEPTKRKSWLDQGAPTPSNVAVGCAKKPTAPVAPQPVQGTLYQPAAPMMCKPPMSVQKKIPTAVPLRVVPGSTSKPIAPVAPQPSEGNRDRCVETARLTRRSSNSSINSRISVASVGSSSSGIYIGHSFVLSLLREE